MKGGKATRTLQMQQIKVASWDGDDGHRTYSVIGLDTNGQVWRYSARDCGWVPYGMEPVAPGNGRGR